MKYPNSFICDCCKKTFHRAKTKAKAEKEHKERIKNLPGYAEAIGDCMKTGEVCDYCYKFIMRDKGFL